jgi:hypothetical protein
LFALSTGIEDERPVVVLDVSLDVEQPVDLVFLHRVLLTLSSTLADIRSVRRVRRAGGCWSHALKIDPVAKFLTTNGFTGEKY